jgi:hypothetical protein
LLAGLVPEYDPLVTLVTIWVDPHLQKKDGSILSILLSCMGTSLLTNQDKQRHNLSNITFPTVTYQKKREYFPLQMLPLEMGEAQEDEEATETPRTIVILPTPMALEAREEEVVAMTHLILPIPVGLLRWCSKTCLSGFWKNGAQRSLVLE